MLYWTFAIYNYYRLADPGIGGAGGVIPPVSPFCPFPESPD